MKSLMIGVIAWAFAAAAAAADWPTSPVRIVVPFPPGGTTDVAARVVAEDLTRKFGQQFLVDNRPGGNTLIGTDFVAKAKPDGHTLLLAAAPFAVVAAMYPKLPFDPVKDFEPITRVAQNGMVLVAYPGAPAKTVQEVLAQARAKPGSVFIASVGTTGVSHMSAQLFAALGGVEVTHVPYKGTGQAMPDVLGGQVPYFFDNAGSSMQHIRAGKLRALAYTGAQRSPAMPDVPTMAEAGLRGYETLNWYGVFAPAQTPAAVLERLNAEIASLLKRPEVAERFAKEAVETVGDPRAEFAGFVKAEIAKWAKIVKERNLKP